MSAGRGPTSCADNRTGPDDEGLSYVALEGVRQMTFTAAVEACPAEIMGAEYAGTHGGLCLLAKIFDFAARTPYPSRPPAVYGCPSRRWLSV